MISVIYTACLILGLLSTVTSLLLLVGTFENRRFARSRRRRVLKSNLLGRATIIAPCKGVEFGLQRNLRRLFEQDYPDFEILFVVESEDDPACPVIRRQIEQHPNISARLLIAGRATQSGQKVHNLLAAVRCLSSETQLLAFVDSDARPRCDWLSRLIARLDRQDVGAVTGYRWFVPQSRSLANHLLYSINALVASLYGPGGFYLIWGGTWAIRREVFQQLDIAGVWRGRLLDDLLAASVIKQAGLRVEFEPACVVASPIETNLPQMGEFMRRQYLLGRFYARRWWLCALLVSTLSVVALVGNAALAIFGFLGGAAWTMQPVSVCIVLLTLHYARAWLRYQMAADYLSELSDGLRRSRRFDLLAVPLVMAVNCLGLLSSSVGNTLTWRGIQYAVFPSGRVRLIGRQPDSVIKNSGSRDNATSPHTVPSPHFHRQESSVQSNIEPPTP